MELFKTELQRFIRGETDLSSLIQAIQTTLETDIEQAARIKDGLKKLENAGHLTPEVTAELLIATEQCVLRAEASDDATQIISDDQTKIANPPIADVEDQTVLAEPEDQTVLAAQDDQTVFAAADDLYPVERRYLFLWSKLPIDVLYCREQDENSKY